MLDQDNDGEQALCLRARGAPMLSDYDVLPLPIIQKLCFEDNVLLQHWHS
jgi:hypothetical protein